MSEEYAKEAARQGAELLDEARPDWWRKIDLEKLDMEAGDNPQDTNGRGCVLCQVYTTDFGHAIMKLRDDVHDDVSTMHIEDVGFDIPDELDESPRLEYDWLDAAWRNEILNRQMKAMASASKEDHA